MKTKIMISQVAIKKKRLVGNNAKFMVDETTLTMIAQEWKLTHVFLLISTWKIIILHKNIFSEIKI